MFQKIAFSAAMAVAVSACSSVAPVLSDSAAAAPLRIRGDLIDLTDVKIFINGAKVIDQRVSLLSGDGEFSGTYAGRPVTASCSTRAQRKVNITSCLVRVDRARETLLTF